MSFEIDADEMNFPCNFCQRVYPKESERNKHERRHHKDQEKKNSSETTKGKGDVSYNTKFKYGD